MLSFLLERITPVLLYLRGGVWKLCKSLRDSYFFLHILHLGEDPVPPLKPVDLLQLPDMHFPLLYVILHFSQYAGLHVAAGFCRRPPPR
jgi:hypothetical protein